MPWVAVGGNVLERAGSPDPAGLTVVTQRPIVRCRAG